MKKETLTAVLIDDEKNANSLMIEMLQQNAPHVKVIGQAISVKEGVKLLADLVPDILFLDIELYDGTGFDLLEKINYDGIHIIFVTAFNNYAVKAFRFSAVDYLLKPVANDDLVAAMEKIGSLSKQTAMLKAAADNYNSLKSRLGKLAVTTPNGYQFIDIRNIVRCESDAKYTTCHMVSGERIVGSKNIGDFDEVLSDYGFVRVHNSHLVNIEHIKSYRIGRGGYVTMKDSTLIPVAQRRKDEVLKRFNKV